MKLIKKSATKNNAVYTSCIISIDNSNILLFRLCLQFLYILSNEYIITIDKLTILISKCQQNLKQYLATCDVSMKLYGTLFSMLINDNINIVKIKRYTLTLQPQKIVQVRAGENCSIFSILTKGRNVCLPFDAYHPICPTNYQTNIK